MNKTKFKTRFLLLFVITLMCSPAYAKSKKKYSFGTKNKTKAVTVAVVDSEFTRHLATLEVGASQTIPRHPLHDAH